MSDNVSIAQDDRRSTYIAGLRAIADLLETTPDLPLPNANTIEWSTSEFTAPNGDPKRELARIARLVPGALSKNDPAESDYSAKYFILSGNVGGMPVEIWAERPKVCTRVVTGTETVDLPAVEALPARTETREIVEWVCEPLLASVTA